MSVATRGWLAELPAGWKLMPAKACFQERREPNRATDVHLTPSQTHGVLPQAEYVALTGNAVVQNIQGQDNMKHVEPDDFIIHLRSFQGGIERSTFEGKVSTAYTVLEPRSPVVSDYFRWLLKSVGYIQELRTTTNQLRDGQSIKFRDFTKVALPVPPPEAQRAIAGYLDREAAGIDALIDEQQRLIRLSLERRQALIDRAVFGIDAGGGTGRRAGAHIGRHLAVEPLLALVPSLWQVKRFKAVLERLDERNSALVFPMMSLKTTGDVAPRAAQQQQPDSASLPRYLVVHSGDLVVNPMWLTGGAIGVSSVNGAVSPDYRVFRSLGDHHPRFLHHLLRSSPYRDQYGLYTRAQTTFDRRVQQPDLDNMPLPAPPLLEQRAIASTIDAQTSKIDSLIAEAQRFIEVARERRSALITAAVTGQIDVRGAA